MNTIAQIAKWTNAVWLQQASDAGIEELVIDTRKIADPENALFIALSTPRRDGQDFVAEAYEKGVRNFLVQRPIAVDHFPDANFLQVTHTQQALQQIAAAHRKQFSVPVIGITGSNGKTVVKEWLYQLLAEELDVVKSPRSYNSQIGVPLSVW